MFRRPEGLLIITMGWLHRWSWPVSSALVVAMFISGHGFLNIPTGRPVTLVDRVVTDGGLRGAKTIPVPLALVPVVLGLPSRSIRECENRHGP